MGPQNNFTTRAQEALQQAHQLTAEHNHQEITSLHLLLALIRQKEGVVSGLLQKLEIPSGTLEQELEEELRFIPYAQGGNSATAQIYISKEIAQVLNQADKEAKKIGDEYISTEHLFLALIQTPSPAEKILNIYRVEYESVLKILKTLRGTHKVTDPDPESKG